MTTVRMTQMKTLSTVVGQQHTRVNTHCFRKNSDCFSFAPVRVCICMFPEGSRCKGFLCSNDTCLPATAHCNGIRECPDGADENNCGECSLLSILVLRDTQHWRGRDIKLPESFLTKIISVNYSVNESVCLLSPTDPLCTRYMDFVCKNRAQCLFQSLVCDGIKHCEDGSDEDAQYAGCGEEHLYACNVATWLHWSLDL